MRGSEDGAAILGVQDSEVVRERISQLREKLQSVRDMIAAQRGGGRAAAGEDTVAAGEDTVAPPPPHLLGSTTKDLPSDRPLNTRAEVGSAKTEQHFKSSNAPINQIQHDTDAALHPKNRFAHAGENAILEKVAVAPPTERGDSATDSSSPTPPLIKGAGTELEYPEIDVFAHRDSQTDSGVGEWEEADMQARNLDQGPPLTVGGLENQMDQILAS